MSGDDVSSGSQPGPLSLRVLSVGRGVGPAYCVRQLADLGAECSWWQWEDDRPGDWPPDKLFRSYFEQGVEVVRRPADLRSVAPVLRRAAGSIDVLVTDFSAAEFGPGQLYRRLSRANPALVVAVASHFGRSGPYAGWSADELTDYAMGGYWGLAGSPGRPPLRVPGYQAQFHGGLVLACATLAAVRAAAATGDGQEVEVSAAEAMIGSHWDATIAWTHVGTTLERRGPDLFRAADGYVFFYQMVPFPALFELIGRPDLAADERWAGWDAWREHAPELWSIVEAWCADRPAAGIVEAAQALRLPVVAMSTAASLLADPVLRERGYFRDVAGHDLPGRPVRWSAEWADTQPPARLAALLDGPGGPAAGRPASGMTRPVRRASAAARPPLAGLRIVEITNNWAGPLAGRHLADLGAEVIKVERIVTPATRAAFQPGGVPGRAHWNRSGYFNEMNRNKRSLALDISAPEGRELFLRLVEQSDAVIENNRPGSLRGQRLDYEHLRERNPRIVMASVSGFGGSGARQGWVAFGSNIEVAAGFAALTGYDAQVPFRSGTFVADPIGGTQTALAVLAALDGVARTGRGSWIDVSLLEAALPFTLLGFTHLHATGRPYQPAGNAEEWDAPTGAYPSAGTDEWICVAVRSDQQWAALSALAGIDPGLGADRAARVRNRASIDAGLSAWSGQLDQYEAVSALQEQGVPAAPILKNHQFHSDRHLHARGVFMPVDHPDMGVFPYPASPWRLSLYRERLARPSPRFGQDNDYVLGELLGLSEDERGDLYSREVVAREPRGMTAV
jgi:crotonobetainyl-CoA:carnitine CoA-transferase CaiB-like acyl-CoA transferase